VRELAVPSDLVFGVALACAYAVVLGVLAGAAGASFATRRWHVVAKIVVVLVGTRLVTAVIGSVLIAAFGPLERPDMPPF
jgi:hypothetical protein